MKNKLFIKIIHLVLLTITLGLSIVSLSQIPVSASIIGTETIITMGYLADICALLCGFIYFAGAYKKDESKYYRIFMICLIISYSFSLSSVIGQSNQFPLYIHLVALIAATILGVGQNLGVKLTFTISVVIIFIQLLVFIIDILSISNISVALLSKDITSILLSTSLAFMVFGKYSDKENRNTK